jgi:hypothetical protein
MPVLESADVLVIVTENQFSMRHLILRELAKKFFFTFSFLVEYDLPCAISEAILLLTNVNVIFIV